MANVRAGGMKSMGVNMELNEHASSAVLFDSYGAVQALSPPKKNPKVVKAKPLPKTVEPHDLGLDPFNPRQKQASYAVDIIVDYEGAIDLDAVHELMEANNFDALPEPRCPKVKEHGLTYSMPALILDHYNAKNTIIKYRERYWRTPLDICINMYIYLTPAGGR